MQRLKSSIGMNAKMHLTDKNRLIGKLAVCLISAVSASMHGYCQEPFFRIIESKEAPLGLMVAKSICQDDLGRIWVGSKTGLYSYDGWDFTKHKPYEKENSSFYVKMLCTPFRNKIHLIADKKFIEYDILTEKFKTIDYPSSCLYGGKDKIWSADKNNIRLWDGSTLAPYYSLEAGTKISAMLSPDGEELLVGTTAGEVIRLNKDKAIVSHTDYDSGIQNIEMDSEKNIWISTSSKGLFKISHKGRTRNYVYDSKNRNSLSSNDVRAICEDDSGNIWIATMEGINMLSEESGEITRYSENRNIPNNSIWSLMKDKQGTIWAATYFGGVFNFNPAYTCYKQLYINNDGNPNPILTQIIEDKDGILWVASEGNGLMRYDRKTGERHFFRHEYGKPETISHNNIKRMYYDRPQNSIWICTHLGGLCRFDIRNRTFKRIFDPAFPKLNEKMIRDMAEYKGTFILAQENRMFIYDTATGRFERALPFLRQDITCLAIHDDKLLCGTYSGLFILRLDELRATRREDVEIMQFDESNGLESTNISTVLVDSKDNIWVGHSNSGISYIDLRHKTVSHYNKNTGTPVGNEISCIRESPSGYVYVASESGLTQFDRNLENIYQYRYPDGFPLQSMYPGYIYCRENGELLMSGINGLVAIDEKKLSHRFSDFSISFCDLKINDKRIVPGDKTRLIDRNVAVCRELRLKHVQNTIALKIQSDNYLKENPVLYEHRLVGIDQDWVKTPENRQIRYAGLPSGRYRLMARGKFRNAKEKDIRTELAIRVMPPAYLKWYALLGYAVLLAGVLYAILRYSNNMTMFKMRLIMADREKEQLLETNKAKLNFFTNVSHEFRTPLTLIMAQLQMLNEMIVPYNMKSKLSSIHKNARKMQDLISELLDFTREENSGLRLKVSPLEIGNFCQEIFESFLEYANFKGIHYSIRNELEGKTEVWFDSGQLQKVLTNLISNAFKYTHRNGEIKLSLEKGLEEIIINVEDTGNGMSKEDLEKIFDCYYQAENISSCPILPSSGIGLALTKAIIRAHHGKIEVNSEKGIGSIFSIFLKLGREHFLDDPNVRIINKEDLDTECCQQLKAESENQLSKDDTIRAHFDKSDILVVEDNDELLALLQQLFSGLCNVHTARNGMEGYRIAKSKQPDLIISDVMMPVMSGFELCSKIKNDFSTCHIPVILLTAYSSSRNQLEGMKNGADDYITKPFNTNLLIIRCNNILQNRRILREKYRNEIASIEDTVITSNNMDRRFIENAVQVVKENLYDENFNSKVFAQKMLMSQTLLYNKLKAITGLSRREFILKIRLKAAAEMIREKPESDIAEIAYHFKFCNPKYFSQCFKEQFGILPTEYRKRH